MTAAPQLGDRHGRKKLRFRKRQQDLALVIAKIKEGNVLSARAVCRGPQRVFDPVDLTTPYLVGMAGVFMHGEYGLVGQELSGKRIQFGQFPSDHQGRAEDAEEAEQGDLLIFRKIRVVVRPVVLAERAYGQHIGIRPVPGTAVGAPFLATFEHIIEGLPVIPEVIGDPPHIADLFVKLRLLQKGSAG